MCARCFAVTVPGGSQPPFLGLVDRRGLTTSSAPPPGQGRPARTHDGPACARSSWPVTGSGAGRETPAVATSAYRRACVAQPLHISLQRAGFAASGLCKPWTPVAIAARTARALCPLRVSASSCPRNFYSATLGDGGVSFLSLSSVAAASAVRVPGEPEHAAHSQPHSKALRRGGPLRGRIGRQRINSLRLHCRSPGRRSRPRFASW